MCFDRKRALLELLVELVWSDAIKIVIVTYIMVSSATKHFAFFIVLSFAFFAPTV